MKSMFFRAWLLVLPWLMLWAGAAHSTSCLNNLPPSNPDEVYIDHGDGTVTDTRTGLMWKQRAEDTWSVAWGDALARSRASTFAGYTDWRLPNVKELSSLVEECQRSPAINRNLFPGFSSGDYWSGSPSARDPRFLYSGSWYVSFGTGTTHNILRSYPARVLLVRGGE